MFFVIPRPVNNSNMHKRTVSCYLKFLVSGFFLLFLFIRSANAQDGEAIFKANCTSCHDVLEKRIGPALKGVSNRHKEDWLLKWVKNSTAVIKSGDADSVKLFNDNNKTNMPAFSLKDEEIKAIFAYIKVEEQK